MSDGGTQEEEFMKVSEVMTRDVRLIEPTQSIQEAARLMAELDAGIMPVREGDRLGRHGHRP
jgi:CBS domain-containing protein